jgi:hypothetical protein
MAIIRVIIQLQTQRCRVIVQVSHAAVSFHLPHPFVSLHPPPPRTVQPRTEHGCTVSDSSHIAVVERLIELLDAADAKLQVQQRSMSPHEYARASSWNGLPPVQPPGKLQQ